MAQLIKYLKSQKGNQKKGIDEIESILINEIKNAFGDTIDFDKDETQPLGLAIAIMNENQTTLDIIRNYSKFSPFALSLEDENAPLPTEVLPN